jgi:two-component system nitrate/nitrite sensor histidine kinase NarX
VGASIADSPILKSQLDDSTLPGFISLRNNNLTLITIPVRYSGKTLGVFHLLLDDTDLIEKKEIIQLFTSIGRHLGIVVEKVKLENNARRLSIIKERTSLANELHDSLAQTLASLRYQVTMVEETVGQSRDRTGILQIRTIKEGLDQANSQLRELLAHFRTRMDERGLLPAIGTLVERFEKQTGIAVYFQNEVTEPILSPAVEVQVLHIVQEALSNIRKHSQANNVRVLIRSDENGNYYVLVEDDGQGIQGHDEEAGPGEHVGLSIMKERAERISGTFSIETEPGEGTRVELRFHAPNESKNL